MSEEQIMMHSSNLKISSGKVLIEGINLFNGVEKTKPQIVQDIIKTLAGKYRTWDEERWSLVDPESDWDQKTACDYVPEEGFFTLEQLSFPYFKKVNTFDFILEYNEIYVKGNAISYVLKPGFVFSRRGIGIDLHYGENHKYYEEIDLVPAEVKHAHHDVYFDNRSSVKVQMDITNPFKKLISKVLGVSEEDTEKDVVKGDGIDSGLAIVDFISIYVPKIPAGHNRKILMFEDEISDDLVKKQGHKKFFDRYLIEILNQENKFGWIANELVNLNYEGDWREISETYQKFFKSDVLDVLKEKGISDFYLFEDLTTSIETKIEVKKKSIEDLI